MCIAIANGSCASLGHTHGPCGQKQRDRQARGERDTTLVKTRCTGDAGLSCAWQPAKRKHLCNSTWQGYWLALLEFYSQWLLRAQEVLSRRRGVTCPGQCLTGQKRLGIDDTADGSDGSQLPALVMVSICDVKPGMPEQGWSNWQACAVLAVQNSSLV
jgi:hypothetical protein